MLPKYHLFTQSSPGIKHMYPLFTGLSLKTQTSDGLQQSRQQFSHTTTVQTLKFNKHTVSKRHSLFSLFFISLCLLSKRKQTKTKNIDVVYITDKIHQYSVLNNFAMNRMNPMPVPPLEQTPLYTVYFTYL